MNLMVKGLLYQALFCRGREREKQKMEGDWPLL
jgi:hypothetical protein